MSSQWDDLIYEAWSLSKALLLLSTSDWGPELDMILWSPIILYNQSLLSGVYSNLPEIKESPAMKLPIHSSNPYTSQQWTRWEMYMEWGKLKGTNIDRFTLMICINFTRMIDLNSAARKSWDVRLYMYMCRQLPHPSPRGIIVLNSPTPTVQA